MSPLRKTSGNLNPLKRTSGRQLKSRLSIPKMNRLQNWKKRLEVISLPTGSKTKRNK
jgi:hypothetical protein